MTNYPAIAATARNMARNASPQYASDLTHIAKDAEAALDGCEASARSVAEFIDGIHELELSVTSQNLTKPSIPGSQTALRFLWDSTQVQTCLLLYCMAYVVPLQAQESRPVGGAGSASTKGDEKADCRCDETQRRWN